jgi:preprotein translocase subunit SecG
LKLAILMIIDAIIAVCLIASVLMQEGKSAGLGGLSGETDTVFSRKARGLDALLAKATVFFAILFGVITLVIAKMTA